MDDLISRQGMCDSLNKYRIEKILEGKDVSLVWECIDKVLQEPSAQLERKRGEWVKTCEEHTDGTWIWSELGVHCSNCYYKLQTTGFLNFCPNCGAVMRGKNMNNAEKFRRTFGVYATEIWSKPENEFLNWLNKEYYALGLDSPTIDDNSPEVVGNSNTLQRPVKCSKPCDRCVFNEECKLLKSANDMLDEIHKQHDKVHDAILRI